jgi:hypothetical protein
MFSSTLAREGWLLILPEKATLTGEAGYVKTRLYELLRLKPKAVSNLIIGSASPA